MIMHNSIYNFKYAQYTIDTYYLTISMQAVGIHVPGDPPGSSDSSEWWAACMGGSVADVPHSVPVAGAGGGSSHHHQQQQCEHHHVQR